LGLSLIFGRQWALAERGVFGRRVRDRRPRLRRRRLDLQYAVVAGSGGARADSDPRQPLVACDHLSAHIRREIDEVAGAQRDLLSACPQAD
jgi:hypothetical protein